MWNYTENMQVLWKILQPADMMILRITCWKDQSYNARTTQKRKVILWLLYSTLTFLTANRSIQLAQYQTQPLFDSGNGQKLLHIDSAHLKILKTLFELCMSFLDPVLNSTYIFQIQSRAQCNKKLIWTNQENNISLFRLYSWC